MIDLYEGLLDGGIFNDIEKTVVTDWLKQNAQGNYKTMLLKNGTLKIWGRLILNSDNIPPLRISFLEGNLYIENSNLTSLEGLFDDLPKIKGNIEITNCPNLTDLTGLPHMIDGDITVTNCKSLRSLEGVNCLAGEVQIMKCGKRFSKSTVSKAFPAAIRIYCSEEDIIADLNEAVVNESFEDPVLVRLYDQLRNLKLKLNIPDLFGAGIQLDKITPSMRETFRIPQDVAKMKSAVNSIVIRGGVNGFIATESFDGEFGYLYNTWGYRFDLHTPANDWAWYARDSNGTRMKVSEIRSDLSAGSRLLSDTKFVHVWKPVGIDAHTIRGDRAAAKSGLIEFDKKSLDRILRVQQDRYRAAVKQLKASRKSDSYKSKVAEVDKIMTRFTKFMHKLIMDPAWANSIGYKRDLVFNVIRKGYIKGALHQEYGVIYAFQCWSNSIVRTLAGDGLYSKIDSTDLDKALARADERLSDVGM